MSAFFKEVGKVEEKLFNHYFMLGEVKFLWFVTLACTSVKLIHENGKMSHDQPQSDLIFFTYEPHQIYILILLGNQGGKLVYYIKCDKNGQICQLTRGKSSFCHVSDSIFYILGNEIADVITCIFYLIRD